MARGGLPKDSVTQLRVKADYGDRALPRHKALNYELRTFVRRFRTSTGIFGVDLNDWRNHLHQAGLDELTTAFLDQNDNGARFWPDSITSPYHNKYSYVSDREYLTDIVKQLFFRLNAQSQRNQRAQQSKAPKQESLSNPISRTASTEPRGNGTGIRLPTQTSLPTVNGSGDTGSISSDRTNPPPYQATDPSSPHGIPATIPQDSPKRSPQLPTQTPPVASQAKSPLTNIPAKRRHNDDSQPSRGGRQVRQTKRTKIDATIPGERTSPRARRKVQKEGYNMDITNWDIDGEPDPGPPRTSSRGRRLKPINDATTSRQRRSHGEDVHSNSEERREATIYYDLTSDNDEPLIDPILRGLSLVSSDQPLGGQTTSATGIRPVADSATMSPTRVAPVAPMAPMDSPLEEYMSPPEEPPNGDLETPGEDVIGDTINDFNADMSNELPKVLHEPSEPDSSVERTRHSQPATPTQPAIPSHAPQPREPGKPHPSTSDGGKPSVDFVYWAMLSRAPWKMKRWSPQGRFQDKKLADLIAELPFGPNIEGITFTVTGANGVLDMVQRLPRGDEPGFDSMKRMINMTIKESIVNHRRQVGPGGPALRLVLDMIVEPMAEATTSPAEEAEPEEEVDLDW